ncbi:MAG: FKBP-type peptidyl-prolyl cis-trans isomerase, partial [Candidatus Xenobia bacterium]
AKAGDQVWIEFIGRLPNGQEVDGSDRHGGAAFHFQLGKGQVIKGWDEGVAGMQPGGIRRLAVPPSLAFGDHQMGAIPPNTPLFFDIALVKTSGG